MVTTIYDQLVEPFPESDIEWRIQSSGFNGENPWALVLCYVQARAIQKRLDNIFGFENWSEEYRSVGNNMICRLGVCVDKKWIYKENGATETNIDSFKGGISGAFKRVASSGFGIGRYLYELDATFANCQTAKDDKLNKAKTSEKKVFYWQTPKLPEWALPGGDKFSTIKSLYENLPEEHQKANKELFTKLKKQLI